MLTTEDMEEFARESSGFSESVYSQWEWKGYLSPRQEAAVRQTLRRRGWVPMDERPKPPSKPSLKPTEEQQAALDTVLAAVEAGEPVAALIGAAGTGKSTMTEHLIYALHQRGVAFIVTATTHPACAVLPAFMAAQTIHSAAALAPHDDGTKGYRPSGGESILPKDGVVLIDEASMADEELVMAVLHRIGEGTLILIGDASQLPPVAGGPAFDDMCRGWGSPVGEMRQVHRVDDLSMAEMLAAYRKDAWDGRRWPFEVKAPWLEVADADAVLDDFFTRLPHRKEEMLVAWTNRAVNQLNRRGRIAKYGDRAEREPFIPGEEMVVNSSVIVDGKVLIQNQQHVRVVQVRPAAQAGVYHVMVLPEGGTLPVEVMSGTEEACSTMLADLLAEAQMWQTEMDSMLAADFGAAAGVFLSARRREDLLDLVQGHDNAEEYLEFDADRRKAWVEYYRLKNSVADLRPTWARTVHKSQGQQTGRVIVLTGDIDKSTDDWRPLAYVAMSRAKHRITLI